MRKAFVKGKSTDFRHVLIPMRGRIVIFEGLMDTSHCLLASGKQLLQKDRIKYV